MDYVNLNRLSYDLMNKFDYIREDGECEGFGSDCECYDYVVDVLAKDFPDLFKKFEKEDLRVSYFEREFYPDEESYCTYTIVIYFSKRATKLLEKIYPEYYL